MIARLSRATAARCLLHWSRWLGRCPAARPRPAAAAADASPAAVALAKQIIEIKGVQGDVRTLVRGVIEKVKEQFLQTNFMWAQGLNEVAVELAEGRCAARRASSSMHVRRIYASHFTEAELKQILAFYQSPLGQKSHRRSRGRSTKPWPMPVHGATTSPKRSSPKCARK